MNPHTHTPERRRRARPRAQLVVTLYHAGKPLVAVTLTTPVMPHRIRGVTGVRIETYSADVEGERLR